MLNIVPKNVVFPDTRFMELPASLLAKQQLAESAHPAMFAPVAGSAAPV